MSWEPAWVPDGRGGFRRNHTNKNSEDVEEGEESGEMKEPAAASATAKKGAKGDEDEEEGEITPLPSDGGPPGPGPGQAPPRSSSTGNLDFRAPYRGRGPNNSRFVANRDRPRQRNSFSGTMPAQRYPGPNTSGNSSFGREGNFSVGGSSAPPAFSPRDAQPPPPPPPPPAFREPPSFRDPHNARDVMDGPPPRTGREFRDFGSGQPGSGLRGDSGLFGARDFRGEPPSLGRDFTDVLPSRDFRGDQAPPPPRDNRDVRGVDQPNFRGEPPLREFRDLPLSRDFRGPPGPPESQGRDYRNDPGSRDFRSASDQMPRDYRGGDGPHRDFRDRNESVPLGSRDFRGGNPPSKREVFSRDPYPNNERSPAMTPATGDNREGYNGPLHREQSSFGSSKGSAPRDQSPYRDGPVRNQPFREGETPYREPAKREGPFREGPRDAPFREGASRDPREVTSKDMPFQGASRDRDIPFGKRDGSSSTAPRDIGRDQNFSSREPYSRGEGVSDRSGRPAEGSLFESKKGDNKREQSFGGGIPPENNFGLKRLDSNVSRDPNSRTGGSSNGQRTNQALHREGNRDTGFHAHNTTPLDRDIPGKNVNKASHHTAVETTLGQSGSSAPTPNFPAAVSNPTIVIGVKSTSVPAATRPTDPRRRPSKELPGTAMQQGMSAALAPQEGSGNLFYAHSTDVPPSSTLAPPVDSVTEKPPIPLPSHPARRMGSYSSLADNSAMPPSLIPTPPLPPDRTNNAGSRIGPSGFRSPLPRRSSDASPRPERGDYYGPSGGPPQGRLRSPATDRGRSISSGGTLSPNNAGAQNSKQQSIPGGGSQHMPLAPVITGRPPHFRQNDPRLKHHERVKAEQEAAYISSSNGRGEDIAKTKGRYDSRSELGSTHPLKSVALNDEAVSGNSSQKNHVDTFGRTREWTENTSTPTSRPPNLVLGSPTRAQQLSSKTRTSTPDQEKEKVSTAPTQDRSSSVDAESHLTEKQLATSETAQASNLASSNTAPTSSSNEGPRSKSEDLPPLRTSSLGDDAVVIRAEAAVQELGLVISTPLLNKTHVNEQSVLPTKQQIMAAITELEKTIKVSQKALEEASEELNVVRDAEDEQFRKEIEQLKAEEKQGIAEREQRMLEKEEEEKMLRVTGLQKAIKNGAGFLLEARKKLEEELEEQVAQAKDDEKRRCYQDMEKQISNAAASFDKDIAKARRDWEKAKTAAQTVETKVYQVETQYRTLLEAKGGDVVGVRGSRERSIPLSTTGVVFSITAENKRKAAEAQLLSLSMLCDSYESRPQIADDAFQTKTDPVHGKTFEEWNILAKRVTGLADPLYSEPTESPYFENNERTHTSIGPSVKEYVRDKQLRLLEHWTQLAEEYEVRKRLYEKQQKKLTRKAQRGSISVAGRKSILGNKEGGERSGFERVGTILESSSRPSNNPYRRARRGNEVRSEYEQDLIIAEIAAKEAMEKRITHGSSKVPRQVCRLERALSASYANVFTAHKVDDPLREAHVEAITNVWSDMEKCIFLDRFLQFPKDFRRIASFLRNKSTKDCVAFYYDSKQSVQYKGALKEHMMRRKRRGDYQVWDASIQSAISVGASVTAGSNEEKPVAFSLPPSDRTFHTRFLHPLDRGLLDSVAIYEEPARVYEFEENPEDSKPRSRKRHRDPLFSLEKEHTKFLCQSSQESMSGMHLTKVPMESGKVLSEESLKPVDTEGATQTPMRKAPQKWTAAEKKIFLDTLEEHGRDWAMLAKAVGTKSISQIKNFYYDFKKQSGKYRSAGEKKTSKPDASRTREADIKSKETIEVAEAPKPVESQSGFDTRSELRAGGRHSVDSAKSLRRSEANDERVGECRSGEEADAPLVDVSQNRVSQTGRGVELLGVQTQEFVESAPVHVPSEASEYGDGNRSLLQQLLSQQIQQQQHQQQQQQDISQRRQSLQQQQQQQHIHIGQQPQSAIQQMLSQHHQRDSQQAGQAALEEVHRLLQQQQTQNHHQQALSNLLPWVTASQLLQTQPRIQHQHQDGNQMAEMNDVANIQRLLQMQQGQTPFGVSSAGHNPLGNLLMSAGGLSSASNSGISPALLSQLDQLGTSGASVSSEPTNSLPAALSGGPGLENLSAMAGAQGLLGFGAPGRLSGSTNGNLGGLGGGGLYRQAGGNGGQGIDAAGVSDALNLLSGAIARREGTPHGFGGVPDRNEGGSRF